MVHKSLPFKLLPMDLDLDGQYVIVYTVVHSLQMVLVGLYFLQAAPVRQLYTLSTRLASFPIENFLIMGDVNMVPDPERDRMSPTATSGPNLQAWEDAFQLVDVCWWQNPVLRAHNRHSATYKTFSSIGLTFSGGPILSRVRDATILLLGISDHAPLVLCLDTSVSPAEGLWRLSQFWLTNPRVDMPYRSELLDFWIRQDASVSLSVTWDTLKAFSRGSLQAIIRMVNMEMGAEIAAAEVSTSNLEATYMQTWDIQVYQSLQLA